MQRVTVTLDDELLAALDALMVQQGTSNRSEAIRDLARAGLTQAAAESSGNHDAPCAAVLTYVYDHHVRELAKRLTQGFHDHHDLSVASLHVHLDHESCLEVAVLRGQAAAVQRFAASMLAERGVRHGRLAILPAHQEGVLF